MRRTKYSVPGSTLAEILVLMIVAGIVFLAVIDGNGAFQRFISQNEKRMIENRAFYDQYEHLDHLVSSADSIRTGERGRLNLFHQGMPAATLEHKDSLLLVRMNNREDTLFRRVAGIDTVENPQAGHLVDSLHVTWLSPRDSTLRLTFGRIRVPASERDLLNAEEERYSYE